MKIVAVDDEKLALKLLVKSIMEAVPQAEIFEFRDANEAFDFVSKNPVDVAFLDIQMQEISGVELAKKLISKEPKINIVFVTGFAEYREDAFELHASGYVTKPVTTEKIANEIKYLRFQNVPNANSEYLIKAQCFGNFDCKDSQGKQIHFERSKAKELFAYLIYRQGASSTAREIGASIFEEGDWSTKEQTYFRQIVLALTNSLKAIGAEDVLIKQFNSFAINPDLIDCDYFDLVLKNKKTTRFMGEFMTQYSWAEDACYYLQELSDK